MRHDCRNCAIRSGALCGALPNAALQQISRLAWRRRIGAGSAVSLDNEDVPVVANLVAGVLRLSKSIHDGRVQIVGLLFPASFVGRPFVDSSALFIEAATDVELCLFPRSQFEAVLGEHESARRFLIERSTAEIDAAREYMLLLGRKSAEERVASLLLLVAERLGGARCDGGAVTEPFDLPLSRTEMALYLGLTLETVVRTMKRLERAGLIACHSIRRTAVKDHSGLRTRAGLDPPAR